MNTFDFTTHLISAGFETCDNVLKGSVVDKRLRTTVLGYWKKEQCFPYLKATRRELLGMSATSAPSERVFSHVGELYSAKRANLGLRIFAILMLMRMNPGLDVNSTWI